MTFFMVSNVLLESAVMFNVYDKKFILIPICLKHALSYVVSAFGEFGFFKNVEACELLEDRIKSASSSPMGG